MYVCMHDMYVYVCIHMLHAHSTSNGFCGSGGGDVMLLRSRAPVEDKVQRPEEALRHPGNTVGPWGVLGL